MKNLFIQSSMSFGRARPAEALFQGRQRVASSAASRRMRLACASALLGGAGLLCIGWMGAAHAQLPPAQTAQGVEYVTGGFGSDAAAAFKEAKSRYPLALTFAATDEDGSTPYVAEVQLEVTDEQGKSVLSLPSVGPFLLADLKPGTYTVRATYEGKAQTQQMKVAGPGSADARIAWKRAAGGPD
ncbi:carboxypeptidase regulatory-like domain-containing protein [Pusillimonas caeni]|uniref:carboxypeptidase-like regulatory domain-containing protein n=1 Tax=Pusillimonas caeni TaxID=1348472 RepID=UPI000E59F826|nr:carboxypeptidase-like regulatory domain-containing protein [Pusillimonas caeni]TFL14875.1 carboxypeptidase regulatory-like domain-containing protein [Pusillimonas caeni]